MIQFTKPTKLNGFQLFEELKSAGIAVKDFPTVDGEGILWLDILAKDEAKAKTIVDAHIGVDTPTESI